MEKEMNISDNGSWNLYYFLIAKKCNDIKVNFISIILNYRWFYEYPKWIKFASVISGMKKWKFPNMFLGQLNGIK